MIPENRIPAGRLIRYFVGKYTWLTFDNAEWVRLDHWNKVDGEGFSTEEDMRSKLDGETHYPIAPAGLSIAEYAEWVVKDVR